MAVNIYLMDNVCVRNLSLVLALEWRNGKYDESNKKKPTSRE